MADFPAGTSTGDMFPIITALGSDQTYFVRDSLRHGVIITFLADLSQNISLSVL